jgi:hypothetical protein
MSLQEAAAQADGLAQSGSERELSQLRAQWDDELEAAARSADFRERALAFRAIGMFRWRAKEELLRRGLDDGSPAARGSAQRETIVLLEGLAVDDGADGDLRRAAGTVAQGLKRKAQEKR